MMAFFPSRSFLMISFPVLMFLLFAASSDATNRVVPVNVICKQAKNPSFCSAILNSKPGGAAGADLFSLCQHTIDVVRGNITNTINLIKSLISHSEKDAAAKAHYKSCLLHFNEYGALGHIEVSEEMVKNKVIPAVAQPAADAIEDIDVCLSEKFSDKSKLPQYADVVEQVIYIILFIAELLMTH